MDRVIPAVAKTNTAFATQQIVDATATSGRTVAFKQYVFPLNAGTAFTTAQTFKGQVLAFEAANANNLASQCIVRVIASDGTTVRATLYAGNTGALTNEWALAQTNRGMPRGTATTPVSCAAAYTSVTGDYLVWEEGFIKLAAATGTGNIRYGDNAASDLLGNETSTADLNTWFEWSGDLAAVASDATGDIFIALETFTDTAGTDVNVHDANWGPTLGPGPIAQINSSGRAYTTGAAFARTWHQYAITPTSAEYDVRGDWYAPNTNNNQGGLTARGSGTINANTHTFYLGMMLNGSIELYKNVVSVETLIASYTRSVVVGTETLEMRVRNATKKLIVNGVERISSTDNSITAANPAGLWFRPVAEAGSSTTGFHADNVQAQDVVTTPPSRRDRTFNNANYRM